MGAQASSNASGELAGKVLRRRGNFRAITGHRQDKHVNQGLLVILVPGFEGKGPGHGDSAPKSASKRGSSHDGTQIELAPQVARSIDH